MASRKPADKKLTLTGSIKSGPAGPADTSDGSARQLHAQLLKAEAMRRQGHLDSAEKICRQLLNYHPTYLGALQTFGLTALEKKNYPQAVNCFLTAAAEAHDDWTNYTNLAAAWLGLEVPQMAALMLREARNLNPNDPEVHFMLGEVASDDRDFGAAMEAYRTALALKPDHAPALFKLSDCLISLGYFTEASDLLLKLRKLRPGSIAVVHLLLQLPAGSLEMDFRKALEISRKQETESQQEFANNKTFVLASVFDREEAYDQAWDAICKANADIWDEHATPLKKALERRARDLEFVHQMTAVKPPSKGRSRSSARPVPLFILGPSRAGKTTLETLVACHPGVKRGYENHNVEFAVKRAAQTAGLVTLKSLLLLPTPLDQLFADKFRERAAASSDHADVLTNTNPGLIGSVGRLAQALPEARFVFMTRNHDDTTLRILMKKYRIGNHHAYSLESARQYVRWYDEMTAVLEQKLPGRALRLRYEDLVTDPSSGVGNVLELCGLQADELTLPEVGSDAGAAKPYCKHMGTA